MSHQIHPFALYGVLNKTYMFVYVYQLGSNATD